jgi:hypothetical protein
MGSGWGSPITITQDGAKLTVEYAFFGRGDMQPPLKFLYALDGSETKNSVMMGRGMQMQTARTAWDGAKLKITTLHTLADPSTGKPMTAEVRSGALARVADLAADRDDESGRPRRPGYDDEDGVSEVVVLLLLLLPHWGHVRIRRVRRNVRVALGRRDEIRHDLVHHALHPGIRVFDVRFLLGIRQEVEQSHQRRNRGAPGSGWNA